MQYRGYMLCRDSSTFTLPFYFLFFCAVNWKNSTLYVGKLFLMPPTTSN